MNRPARRTLLPHHEEMLSRRGISPEAAREHGYQSVSDLNRLAELGFDATRDQVPGLLVPIHDLTGFRYYSYLPDNAGE